MREWSKFKSLTPAKPNKIAGGKFPICFFPESDNCHDEYYLFLKLTNESLTDNKSGIKKSFFKQLL